MFGLIISSRPVLTEPTTLSPTQLAFTIPTSPPFSHIVVFLLPGTVLPDGTAAAVYAQLAGSTEFKLLGAIANEKPSAIFKINKAAGGPAGGGVGEEDEDAMVDEDEVRGHVAAAAETMTVGISLEPAAQVLANLAQLKTSAPNTSANPAASSTLATLPVIKHGESVADTKMLAQRIIKNCYDFLTSWGTGDTVPLKAFEAWWKKFEGKMERDPGFLERGDGG
ncbi:hypothetical protein P154DRAFT_106757 [Amniculicola lignicola CBS 123094]|uniref:Uncharacterized protein n=1 Tax=Amniculicola lignicola CBS 123094 TaxID=1392246 RepID=A0A6A5VU22_9PLEO|nr:hypothetical protein P154DRAFT_106757 [Amniculicola lignicola CBS 123094]